MYFHQVLAAEHDLVDLNYVEDTHTRAAAIFLGHFGNYGGYARRAMGEAFSVASFGQRNGTCREQEGVPEGSTRRRLRFPRAAGDLPSSARSPVRIDNRVADLHRVAGGATGGRRPPKMSPPPMPRPQ